MNYRPSKGSLVCDEHGDEIRAKVPQKPLHLREKRAKFQTKAQKNSKAQVIQKNNNHDPYGRFVPYQGDTQIFRDCWHRVSAKFEFRYENLNSRLSLIPFVYTLVTGCPKKRENHPGKGF